MSEAKLRTVLRWVHITSGLVIMCYIYAPFGEKTQFQVFVRFVVVPVIALTGVWIWKFAVLNKFFRIKYR